MKQLKTKRILASVNATLVVAAMAIGMQAPLAATSSVLAAGSTPWLDRDNTGGVGDFELTHQILKFQCKLSDGTPVTNGQPHAGYHTGGKTNHGCWCVNKDAATAKGKCEDIKIKYFWQ